MSAMKEKIELVQKRIERYSFSVHAKRDHGLSEYEATGELGDVYLRPDGLLTNVTEPHQVFIDEIVFQVNGTDHPQLSGEHMDAYVFSVTALERERQAYMERYGLKTEDEYLTFVERVGKVWDLYELGKGPKPKEDLPPQRPRLDLMTLEPNSRVFVRGTWGIGDAMVVSFLGFAREK